MDETRVREGPSTVSKINARKKIVGAITLASDNKAITKAHFDDDLDGS